MGEYTYIVGLAIMGLAVFTVGMIAAMIERSHGSTSSAATDANASRTSTSHADPILSASK